jgi:hypothetical protein
MERHRAVIIGAGRIGAGYKWDQDLGYTHAGAYMALKDRVELVGFVETDEERRKEAMNKWNVDVGDSLDFFREADIVSVCVHPEQQGGVLAQLAGVKGVWCEKPWVSPNVHFQVPVQVNYQRRADLFHQELARMPHNNLVVYGKDDETTRCHFRDLSRWWKVPLDYRPFQGPCAYALDSIFFDNGGVDSAECFKGMLGNLLDAVEGKTELWSPPYVENK